MILIHVAMRDKNMSSSIGGNWNDLRKELFTPEEILESDIRVSIINELIKIRQEKGISQRELEVMSGVKQPIIARLEKGKASPNIETLTKLLLPFRKNNRYCSSG